MKRSAVRPVAATLLREAAVTVLLLLGVSLVVFGILGLAPGDPFAAILGGPEGGEGPAPAGAAPGWGARYAAWLSGILAGDFGRSVRTGLPVLPELLRVGGNTLVLTLGAMLVTLLVAVPVALHAALKRSRWSVPLALLCDVASALPVFWLGYVVLYATMRAFGVFPLAFGAAAEQSGSKWLFALLPILVLGVGNGTTSEVVRRLREEMERVLGEEYVRAARARGASVFRHAFREGFLLPVTEIVASKIPYVLGGAVIVEQVFNWPGMGRLAWQAAQDRDYPVIVGIALAAALIVRLGSLARRVVYVWVNPGASRE